MKLVNIFALIATTMVVSTEAIQLESQKERMKEGASKIEEARAAALADAQGFFEKLDIDGDGQISREDMNVVARQTDEINSEADQAALDVEIDEFFTQFDTNADGMLPQSEWLEYFGSVFDLELQKQLEEQVTDLAQITGISD